MAGVFKKEALSTCTIRGTGPRPGLCQDGVETIMSNYYRYFTMVTVLQ